MKNCTNNQKPSRHFNSIFRIPGMVCLLNILVLIFLLPGCSKKSSPVETNEFPGLTEPVLFNTPEADEILNNLQIFPEDSPYNEDISERPVASNSTAMIEGMAARKRLGFNLDMGYIIVPANQKLVDVEIYAYPDESDPGPFPIPDNAPIEGWPFPGQEGTFSLDSMQREGEGDRHVLVLDPYAKKIYELYATYKTDTGWRAAQASVFDFSSNKMRPQGWTSADAAGLSVFAGTVRYPDVVKGIVPHVIRVTARRTRNEYVYPASHYASKLTDSHLPRMGERFRLKPSTDISSFSPHAQAIAKGMMKYGLIVADNGLDWLISVAPDDRFEGLEDLLKLVPGDFEVIVPSEPKN